MPYIAIPRPEHAPRFNDYEYLERISEWGLSQNNTDIDEAA